MKGWRSAYLSPSLASILVLPLLFLAQNPAFAANGGSRKIVGGYFEEWSIYGANYNVANLENNRVASRITHLLYAFGNVAPTSGAADAQCHLADPWADYQDPNIPSVSGTPYMNLPFGNFGALIQLKQLHPDLKIIISLGGASSTNAAGFAYAASTEAGRKSLASSCIDMFIRGNVATDGSGNPVSTGSLFDGIDIDWEFPSSADKKNFTLLLREFRKELTDLGAQNHKHYLLSFFAPAGSQNYANIELVKVSKLVDFLNLQGYDLHGTWETSTNHASSLFDSKQDPAFGQGLDVEAVVRAYLEAGVAGRKLVLGIPLYGYGWTGVPDVNAGLYQSSTGPAPSPPGDSLGTDGVATYGTLATLSGFHRHYDAQRIAQWIYDPTTETFWTFDDPFIVRAKTVYIMRRVREGLGGAYVWAFKDDNASGAVVKTMASGLGH